MSLQNVSKIPCSTFWQDQRTVDIQHVRNFQTCQYYDRILSETEINHSTAPLGRVHSHTRRGRQHAHQQLPWHVQLNVTLAGNFKRDAYKLFSTWSYVQCQDMPKQNQANHFFSCPPLWSSKQFSGLSLPDIRCIEITRWHPAWLFVGNTLISGGETWSRIKGINNRLLQAFSNTATGDKDMPRCVLERFVSRA